MTNKDQLAVWARVQRWIDNGPSDEERATLREHMRRSVLSRRNRKKVRTGNVDKIRRAIFEALAPDDLVERHRWLFAEQWVSESGDDIWDDDFDYNKHEARSDEHTSELQSLMRISYAVFCLKKKITQQV